MAHTHDVHDTGKRFEINGISRFIKETSETKLVLVQGDHKSEVVTFEMPRFIDGHDMLLCNKIRVHYINIETKTNNTSADIYEVTDLKLCEDCGEEEEETLMFTWTIEAPATKYFGSLSFLVKFECTEGDNILYQWNTARYVNVNVLNGIDNSEAFVDKYSNVLEEWYAKLMGEAEDVANLVETAGQQLEDCAEATQNATEATRNCVEATESANEATQNANAVRKEVEAGGYIESLKELNKGGKLTFWVGTQAEYEALETKSGNCFYIITDDATPTKIDEIKDYVVETGTDGIWTYRKWASGIAECWAGVSDTLSSIIKVSDTYFYAVLPIQGNDYDGGVPFPENLFRDVPCVQYTVSNDSGLNGLGIGRGTFKEVKACPTKTATGCLYLDFSNTIYVDVNWVQEPFGDAVKLKFTNAQYVPIHASLEAKGRWK